LAALAYFPRTASFKSPTAYRGKAEAVGNVQPA
jgi:hypothetical protein